MFLDKSTKSLLLFGLLFSLRLDAGATELEDGITCFQRSNYTGAALLFQRAVAHEPKNVNAHYYLATSYLKLQKRKEAIYEYELVSKLDPTGLAGQYSLTALSELEEQQGKAISEPADCQSAQASAHAPANTDVCKSVETIGKETDLRSAAVDREANEHVQHLMLESAARIEVIEQEIEQSLANSGISWRYKSSPAYQAIAQSIRDEGNKRIDTIKEDTRRDIEAVLAESKSRKLAYEEAALRVDRQYVDKTATDHKLMPKLTNMYVQTYRTDAEASGAQVPVLATPRSIQWKK
jgi:tetratricopeptide (TPR) repeat protein